LSWATVLRKREAFRQAFDDFDPERIARYRAAKLARLLADPGIIRNRQKVRAAVENARAFLGLVERRGSFDAFVWEFVGGRPRRNAWKTMRQVPARTTQSDRLSAALKAEGFAFVGSTICYAYMQAAGLVNDHLTSCFRYSELAPRRGEPRRPRGVAYIPGAPGGAVIRRRAPTTHSA